MAAALRPLLLRRALVAPSTRAFTTAAPAIRSHLLRRAALPAVQRAAFQTTTHRSILPALPQHIDGGVNEPAKVPETSPSHGSYHWTAERVMSIALVPLTIMPFAAGSLSPLLDGALIGTLLIHSYIGFESSITDYLPKWRVPRTRRLFDYANLLALFVVGWGWYEFETNDVGLTEAIRRIWTAKKVTE